MQHRERAAAKVAKPARAVLEAWHVSDFRLGAHLFPIAHAHRDRRGLWNMQPVHVEVNLDRFVGQVFDVVAEFADGRRRRSRRPCEFCDQVVDLLNQRAKPFFHWRRKVELAEIGQFFAFEVGQLARLDHLVDHGLQPDRDVLPRLERVGDKVLHLVAHTCDHRVNICAAFGEDLPILLERARRLVQPRLVKPGAETFELDPVFLGGLFHAFKIDMRLGGHLHQQVLVFTCEASRLAQFFKPRFQVRR